MKLLAWLFLIGLIITFTISSILSALNSRPDEQFEKSRPIRSSPEWPIMDESFKNIFWIVQLSDIHISSYRDLARGPDLLRFCREYVNAIDPELVIITGDLTDAKDQTNIFSLQNLNEWEVYHRTVKKCQEITRGKWLDIRGNHDSFDVFNFESKNNYYSHFSVFGNDLTEKQAGSYHYRHSLPFGNYSFVGFDASVTPGSNRPFNFFGFLDDKQVQQITRLSEESHSSNHTVWFSHFPSSLIVHDPPVLRSVMRESIAYLCGHLHTLGNFVPHMYSRQKTGQLELELGDWKDNRKFRVIAFDHDLLSFADNMLGDWPLIVVTNPKNSQFYSDNEPVEMIQYSTHIRILIFNPDPIAFVRVKIDGVNVGLAENVKGPLFVKAWDPLEFKEGLHKIQIIVKDKAERQRMMTQHFTLNDASPEFDIMPRLLLMLNIFSVGKIIFGLLVFSFTFVLTSFRQCSNIRPFYVHGIPLLGSLINSLLMKVWLASQATPIYSILIGCVIYLTFGPWFYGEMLKDHNGVVFAWGIVFEHAFIPSGITYFYGIFQMLTFNLPLLFLLGHILDSKRKMGHRFTFMRITFPYICSVILFVFWTYVTLKEFPTAYGLKALYFGPLRIGCVFIIPISIWLSLKYECKIPMAVNGVH